MNTAPLEEFKTSYDGEKIIENIITFKEIVNSFISEIIRYSRNNNLTFLTSEFNRLNLYNNIEFCMDLIRADIRRLNRADFQYTINLYAVLTQFQEMVNNPSGSVYNYTQNQSNLNIEFSRLLSLARLEFPAMQTESSRSFIEPPAAATRERFIYFTQIDYNGQILHTRVTRQIPVSQSPMQNTLNVLLAGPSEDELSQGILNLIPQNTRVLSATIRGSTAYINFSEDFLFNTFGVNGYIAQLRQIVWTVTEFQNVRDVQILIEGRRMDRLGEGLWIGSPINRQSF